MTDVTSSAATNVSCKVCGPLHRGSRAQEWFILSNSNVHFGEVLAPVFIKSTTDEILETLEKVRRDGNDVTSKLSTRGWVFQEQTLSPRTLHFGESEIGWECLSVISCECTATGLRFRRTESLLKKARTVMPWSDAITQYSRLELTVPGDRLVALAGLASVWPEAPRRERYVAGMWERDLPNQLTWCAQDAGNERGLPHEYIAPSWSWASVNQPVVYNHTSELEPNFTIKNIQCQPQGASLFGNCKPGASLIITGSRCLLGRSSVVHQLGRGVTKRAQEKKTVSG